MALIKALPKFKSDKKTKKKRKIETSDSEDETNHFLTTKKGKTTVDINDTSDEDSAYFCSNNYTKQSSFITTMAKKAKVDHKTTEIVGEILDWKGQLVPLQILLDTGSTATILLKHFEQPGTPKAYKGQKSTWRTMGGNFVTQQRRQIQF